MKKDKIKPRTIVTDHKANFETLTQVFQKGTPVLLDCILKSTGEHVAVIGSYYHNPDATDGLSEELTPFAIFFNGNPFEMLISLGDPVFDSYDASKADTDKNLLNQAITLLKAISEDDGFATELGLGLDEQIIQFLNKTKQYP